MPDFFDICKNWWKQMMAVILVSLLVAGVLAWLKPKLYLSVATAVPASIYATDKSKIFNENIQALYSALGTPDDLDMIVGTAKLDTVYLAVTDKFNLYDHYKTKDRGEAVRLKAALMLKKNTRVIKSEYGELKVKCWDTDRFLSPQLANAILDQLKAMHQDLQNAGNISTLKALTAAKEKLRSRADSTTVESKPSLGQRINEYDKLIAEYQLMVDSKPPVLIIVEQAKAASAPDKPKLLQILLATAALSFVFSLLLAIILERRKATAV